MKPGKAYLNKKSQQCFSGRPFFSPLSKVMTRCPQCTAGVLKWRPVSQQWPTMASALGFGRASVLREKTSVEMQAFNVEKSNMGDELFYLFYFYFC